MIGFDEMRKLNFREMLKIPEKDQNLIDEIFISEKIINKIICIKQFDKKEEFEDNWKESVHFTAGYIQSNLEKFDFEEDMAWDIYLIFLINFQIDLEFKNQIERDKFCCKKYVVDIRDYSSHEEAIKDRIPLFADFNSKNMNKCYFLANDTLVRERITEGLNTPLAIYFQKKENIDKIDCQLILNELKEFYNE